MDSGPRTAVAIVLALRDDRVFVARRKAESHLGGTWEFPGGKVESGEEPVAAALRELREETGLAATELEPLVTALHDYPDRNLQFHVFVARDVTGEVDVDGGREHRWVGIPELASLDMPEVNGTFIRALRWRFAGDRE